MKKINFEALLFVLFNFLMGITIVALLFTNNIKNYIHPRFNWLLWISSIFLIIIAIVFIKKIFYIQHRQSYIPIILMMSIFVVVLVYPTKTTISTRIDSQSIKVKVEKTLLEKYREQDYIVIDDYDYLKWFYDINNNLSLYEGKTVKFNGFVLKGINGYLPIRNVMVCCASDVAALGLTVKDNVLESYNKSWVKLEAKIIRVYSEQFKMDLPQLDIKNVEVIPEIKDALLYP